MKTKSVFILFCTLNLLINACAPSGIPVVVSPVALSNAEVSISMMTPHNGEIFVVSNFRTITLQGHAPTTNATSTISSRTFLANGISVGTSPTTFGYDDFEATWSPSTSGEYYIQAKVTLADGSTAISEPHRICVMPIYSWVDVYSGDGYMGPCAIPTRNPNHATSGAITLNAVETPFSVSYSPLCPSYPSVTFIATVVDPQDMNAFASVTLSNVHGIYHVHYLNWVTTRAGNQKEYRGTIQIDQDLFSSVPQIYAYAPMTWRVTSYLRDGQPSGQVRGLIDIRSLQCSQQRPGINPPTLTPTAAVLEVVPQLQLFIPPTFTLTMNSFCRRGPNMSFSTLTSFTAGEIGDILNISEDGIWYFVDWKKADAKCWVATRTGDVSGDLTGLKVLIVPTLDVPEPSTKPTLPPESEPALPPASGCSSYGDASSCTTNGCSWDKPSNTCN